MNAQRRAMVHTFLGDALLALGDILGAREQWKTAITLDPVSPPYGMAGIAEDRLSRYPHSDDNVNP
jgi:hypothetical protein